MPDDKVKYNFGCGGNILDGWRNHDADIDLRKPLPIPSRTVDFILAEHCVEHLTQQEAYCFFTECLRVLKPGGVLRVAVPSLGQIMAIGTQEYLAFVAQQGWSDGSLKGALRALMFNHGHKSAWTRELLEAMLVAAGFDYTVPETVGQSRRYQELRGVEGHGKVIGEKMNNIETVVVEANAA